MPVGRRYWSLMLLASLSGGACLNWQRTLANAMESLPAFVPQARACALLNKYQQSLLPCCRVPSAKMRGLIADCYHRAQSTFQ